MDEKGFDTINVIPFIDIMLVLLTIVLTTATFIANTTIPVNLPKAEQSSTESQGLKVEINQAGKIYFDGFEVSRESLRTALAVENKQLPMVIRADRAVALQSFVDVLSIVRELGFAKMSLQTEKSR
ncbi:biopolymer transporter ExbD [Desulfopila sp. IMCC35006]|uniref:ExbD/TolR family protein n=1 Tax=Desulfopila sp. IMCC35006 TaxID=2569542 RepID=UPI0010AD70A0|nr:biopolymer transporter ExbD [Desulfopila sp. IMCC35006]TKB24496.1 biopolymer transporter ExbD [Desulfopila sp. IMCC35006]